MNVLGWDLATDESKNRPFAKAFDVLGVRLDLGLIPRHEVGVSHKAGRIETIVESLDLALSGGKLSAAEAASLAGRLHYLDSAFFGRCGAVALHCVRQRGNVGGSDAVTGSLATALRWLRVYLANAQPRRVPLQLRVDPLVVLTDGACDPGVTTIGGVLLERGSHPRFFGLTVPQGVADTWRSGDSYQVVGQAEIIPVLVARLTWAEILRGKHVVYFIDNNAARQALIKGYSPSLPSCRILGEAAMADAKLGCFSWYARVPSASNASDPASRLDFDRVRAVLPGATWTEPVVPRAWLRERKEAADEWFS